jgi:phospholipid/cholesterol/gamma-HCH transport system permease protein
MPSDSQTDSIPPTRILWNLPSATGRIGRFSLDTASTIRGSLALSLITLTTLLTLVFEKHPPLWPLLRHQIAKSGVRLLPWVTLLAAGLGLVVIGQMLGVFTGFGANRYIGAILVSTVIHELGPIVVSVLVLSVVGTATVIDLATARVTGKLDILNESPKKVAQALIIPRVLGLSLSIFCLTIYFITLTLVFSYAIVLLQDIPLAPIAFAKQIAEAITWESFLLIGVKSFSFGSIIGIVACFEGLVRPIEMEHLSAATIRTVMGSITLCTLLDAVFISYLLL